MVEYTTIGGYAAILAVGAGYFYLSQRSGRSGRNVRNKVQKGVRRASETVKSKAANIEAGLSSAAEGNTSQDNEKKKNKKKDKAKKVTTAAEPQTAPTATSSSKQKDDEDDVDNLAFARQMSSAQTGYVAPPKSAAAAKQRSVKQSKAATPQTNGVATTQTTSPPSSTADVDGDDDLSPVNSPQVTAIGSGRDVSDMLEAPAAGPSILRIASPTQPTQTREKKPATAPQPAETKKQRQNRKKNEEKKAAREAEEVERRQLEEKQRRTARIAEGRAAKDGSAFLAAHPPAKAAWNGPAPATNGQTSGAPANGELLDTFTETPKTAPVSNGAKSSGLADLPSEEEQMRRLREETEWQDVPNKKNKKNAIGAKATGENAPVANKPATQENSKPVSAPVVKTPVAQEKPKEIPPHKQTNSAPLHEVQVQYPSAAGTVEETRFAQDDEWEVS